MERIAVIQPVAFREFGMSNTEAAEELAETIRANLEGYEVVVGRHQGAGEAFEILQRARTITVYVPWDSIVGAAAGVLLETIRQALTGRVKALLATRAKSTRQDEDPEYLFPEDTSIEERAEARRTIPFRVVIYGPRGHLLSVIEQEEEMDEAVITRSSEIDLV